MFKKFTLISSFVCWTLISLCNRGCYADNIPKWPEYLDQFSQTKEVYETIVLTEAGVYDFKNVLHLWKGKKADVSKDTIRENGPQILRVKGNNITVKNFIFKGDGKDGTNWLGDPIHLVTSDEGQGNNGEAGPFDVTLDHVVGHAAEDLLTLTSPGGGDIEIKNCVFFSVPNGIISDKTVQVNFGGNITFRNNTFVGGARCIRGKPQTNGRIIGNIFYNCENAIKITSNDADIPPMKNGPSYWLIEGNAFYNVRDLLLTEGNECYFVTGVNKLYNSSKGIYQDNLNQFNPDEKIISPKENKNKQDKKDKQNKKDKQEKKEKKSLRRGF